MLERPEGIEPFSARFGRPAHEPVMLGACWLREVDLHHRHGGYEPLALLAELPRINWQAAKESNPTGRFWRPAHSQSAAYKLPLTVGVATSSMMFSKRPVNGLPS